ncbi:hypothetical protein BCCGELA001_03030 [Bradyrhizobium sp. CCGE-LA001]|nr:hypothetical protein BCCGELA001_03030 [Bradyrhizobium sp. CCGE-LA001]
MFQFFDELNCVDMQLFEAPRISIRRIEIISERKHYVCWRIENTGIAKLIPFKPAHSSRTFRRGRNLKLRDVARVETGVKRHLRKRDFMLEWTRGLFATGRISDADWGRADHHENASNAGRGYPGLS